MNMFDEARALWGTMRMVGTTQEELAKKLGVSQSFVANKLRLLRFGTELQDEIVERSLSERHARALLRLPTAKLQHGVLERVVEDSLTVQDTERIVDAILEDEEEMGGEEVLYRLSRILAAYAELISPVKTIKTIEEDDEEIRLTVSVKKRNVG